MCCVLCLLLFISQYFIERNFKLVDYNNFDLNLLKNRIWYMLVCVCVCESVYLSIHLKSSRFTDHQWIHSCLISIVGAWFCSQWVKFLHFSLHLCMYPGRTHFTPGQMFPVAPCGRKKHFSLVFRAADGENTTGRRKGVSIDNPLSQRLTHHTGLKLNLMELSCSKSGQMVVSVI